MNEMKKSNKNRKALLIISDGGDNSSRYTETEVKNLVRENDVLIYAIGVFESGGGRMRTTEEAGGPGLLNDLCEQTGGRHLPADVSELPDIAAKIGVELRNRYVLGYSPTTPGARRPLPHAASENRPAQGTARAAPLLPPRLLRAQTVVFALPHPWNFRLCPGVYLGGG